MLLTTNELSYCSVTASAQELKKKGTKGANFGSGKRRRDQARDILANIRDGFAKRRARLGGKMEASGVASFGAALGLDIGGGGGGGSSSSSSSSSVDNEN